MKLIAAEDLIYSIKSAADGQMHQYIVSKLQRDMF